MRTRISPAFRIQFLALAALLLPTGACADQALVVGVNQYPGLKNTRLKGCVDDAHNLGNALKKYGFKVKLIADGRATRNGILAALEVMHTLNGPTERFVFYFAGYGSRSAEGEPVLLPSDAGGVAGSGDLSIHELEKMIADVPAQSRTIVLDTCFSGGAKSALSRLREKHPASQVRYYERKIDSVPDAGPPADPARDQPGANLPPICYFSAARPYEPAVEDEVEGSRQGLFTHSLCRRLNGDKQPWGELHKAVAGDIAEPTSEVQHPILSPAFADVPVFDESRAAAWTNPLFPTWAEFSDDHPDPDQVKLSLIPDRTTFKVAERLTLTATAGAEGCLVVLEKGAGGAVSLLFPKSRSVDDAHVKKGWTVTLPGPGKAYTPDRHGLERIRAFLFTSAEAAQQIIKRFPESARLPTMRQAAMGGSDTPGTYYTSDLAFDVAPTRNPDR